MIKEMADKELLEEVSKRFKEKTHAIENLREMMIELEIVNEKLKESEAMKSDFISNIRNEINNPLSSIMALSDGMLTIDATEKETICSLASTIHTEACELDFQMNNIFIASELEAGDVMPEISKVCLVSTTNDVINSVQNRLKHKKVSIKTGPNLQNGELFFRTDAEKLSVVLINLLSNAVEFSEPGSEAELNAEVSDGVLSISVKDSGIGIDEADVGAIFDRFKQLERGSTKTHRGQGLGLSVAKALLDIIGGNIEVKSKKGKGSTFTVTIPEAEMINEEVSFTGNEELFFDNDDSMEIF